MKKSHVTRAVLASTLIVSTAACSSSSGGADDIDWKSAWYVGPGHVSYDEGAEVFKEELNGADVGINVELYPSEQLGKVAESLTMLESGVADEVFTSPGYHLSQLPLLGAWDLPLGYSQEVVVESRWRAAHEDGPYVQQLKDAGLVPLIINATPNPEFSSLSRELDGPDDLRGMQVRVPNDLMADAVNAVGGVGVTGPSSELFETLQRGVVDGTIYYYGSFDTVGIDTLMKHGTGNVNLPPSIVGSFVTQETWDEFSEEQQRAIYDAARSATESGSTALRDDTEGDIATLESGGLEIVDWSDGDIENFYDLMDTVIEGWIADQGGQSEAAVKQIRDAAEASTDDGSIDLVDDFESFKF